MLEQKIVLLATGGTIASSGQPEKGDLIADIKGKQLIGCLPGISDIGKRVVVEDFSTVNSTYMTPDMMVNLAQHINKLLAKEDVASVVITHGTALMEETAFVLDLLISDPKKPVILTGAQRNATYPWPDGIPNLNDALRVAAAPQSTGMGVVVVFCGCIHEGYGIRKVHSSALYAFSSGEHGALGSIYYNKVTYFRERRRRSLPFETYKPCSVAIIPFYSGADDRYIRTAIESGESGLIVESVAIGNVNKNYYEGIKAAREHGLPVIITSRCLYGELFPLYAYKGGGASLKNLGVMFSSLSSPQARLFLMLAIGCGCSMNLVSEQLI